MAEDDLGNARGRVRRAKRWFYYTREGATVESLDELRAAIKRNERAELAFLMVASAEWAKRYKFLALAYCRRTWCHHLVLDFLAVRPGVSFANQPIFGIGSGILASLAEMADSLGMAIGSGRSSSRVNALLMIVETTQENRCEQDGCSERAAARPAAVVETNRFCQARRKVARSTALMGQTQLPEFALEPSLSSVNFGL